MHAAARIRGCERGLGRGRCPFGPRSVQLTPDIPRAGIFVQCTDCARLPYVKVRQASVR